MIFAVVIICGTVLVVFGVYFATRAVMGTPEDRTVDLAAAVLFRIAALHGLVLALVFASEVVDYHQLAYETTVEASAIADVYHDAGRYGEAAEAVRAEMSRYIDLLPEQEWTLLGTQGLLLDAAWGHWDAAYAAVLDLAPGTPREQALFENMLSNIHMIAQNRDLRLHHASSMLSPLFWAAAVLGILLISAGFYTYPPKRDNLVLLAFFAGYTGFILFTIFAMSNAFRDPAGLDPTAFIELRDNING